jgi:hypothetical protein
MLRKKSPYGNKGKKCKRKVLSIVIDGKLKESI